MKSCRFSATYWLNKSFQLQSTGVAKVIADLADEIRTAELLISLDHLKMNKPAPKVIHFNNDYYASLKAIIS